tara:strand:- start:1508 stop:2233 length:726 start_codon:yes stop_codon:yes gene_type:complete
MRLFVLTIALLWGGLAIANEIYITQIGDSLDLDISQDGQDNQIGTSVADADFGGDDMTFDITQTGSLNTIAAVINGNNYTGTWVFTGSGNSVDLQCDANGVNCETVTLNMSVIGDDQVFDIDIGGVQAATGTVANFTVTGDGNVFESTIDGVNAVLTVTVDSSNSLASTAGTDGTLTAAAVTGSTFDISQTGDGDSAGHSIILDVTGGGSSYNITQSGIYDNAIDADFTGDAQDVDITQTD